MKLKEKMVNSMINGVNLKVNIDDYILRKGMENGQRIFVTSAKCNETI